jgi:hypothetical protein
MRKRLIFGLTAFLSTAAFAQQQNGTLTTNLDRFAINPSGNGSLLISDGELVPEGQLTLSLLSSYAQHLSLTRGTDSSTPSMDRLYGHLAASFGLTDWAEGSFQLPLILSESAVGTSSALALATYAPILALRAGVNEGASMPVSLSVELAATFLFGSSTSAISVANSRPMPALRLNVGKNLGDVRVFGELNAIEHVDETFRASATQAGSASTSRSAPASPRRPPERWSSTSTTAEPPRSCTSAPATRRRTSSRWWPRAVQRSAI